MRTRFGLNSPSCFFRPDELSRVFRNVPSRAPRSVSVGAAEPPASSHAQPLLDAALLLLSSPGSRGRLRYADFYGGDEEGSGSEEEDEFGDVSGDEVGGMLPCDRLEAGHLCLLSLETPTTPRALRTHGKSLP